MSAPRLLPRLARTLPTAARHFSTTPASLLPRRRPTPSLPSEDILPKPTPISDYHSEKHIQQLLELYTPAQVSALLAGELAIPTDEFNENRIPRREGEPMALQYIDDLSQLDPILDLPPPNAPKHRRKYDSEGWVIPQHNLPKIEDPNVHYPEVDDKGDMFKNLSALTGMTTAQLKAIQTRPMVVHGVVNQTRMGKIRKVYALSIAGNGNGLLGIGEGKSAEAEDAIRQANYMAIRNLEPVTRYENRTIYGNVEIKNGAVEMQVMTRPPGFGVRCSQYIFEMCKLAGIQDLSAKVTRSRNPMNVIKTFMMALRKQRLPEVIARGRGKKFVDVRKVYYDGQI